MTWILIFFANGVKNDYYVIMLVIVELMVNFIGE
jgi:hypothetical protein